MKKLLLFVLAIGIGFSSFSQAGKHVLRSTKAPMAKVLMEKAPQSAPTIMVSETPANTDNLKSTNATFVPMGQSGNTYGLYSNPRTYLWADPSINSVVFTHRMTGGTEIDGNSRVSYDVSTDGGATFTNNVLAYSPLPGPGGEYPLAGGRYPQGAILNPEGNTDPANAFYTYFICTLDNTNGNWGGYGYGSNPLTATDPSTPSQVNLTSGGDYWRLIPDAYTVTQQGTAWYVDGNYDGADYVYTGQLTLGKGEMVDGEIAFEESLIDFFDAGMGINDHKIAFAPDGQTGYILIMTAANDIIPYTSYHPVLLKTTDGGDTWSDPIHMQFGGVDGNETIKYYWSDELIESLDAYEPGFNRDEVFYNMGFSADLIVDGKGNPHVVGLLTVASADGWYPSEGAMATWHVYSDDGGDTWDADPLYDNIWFDGEIGTLGMWNRPYAASTMDGHYLFFSWIDTDLEGAESNVNPNIFVTGYDSEDHTYNDGGVQNVTALSLYWFSAFYGSMSQYVFAEEGAEMVDCEIPFMFTEYTVPGDPAAEMNFYYIKDYTMSMPVGVQNHEDITNFSVSQNIPNPAVNSTNIMVSTETPGVINLSVSNILGQVIHKESVNNSALSHTFQLNVSNLESGIYFYTIELGNSSITKKMLVK